MKKILLVFLYAIFISNTLCSQTIWNLKQAIDYAIANNISVKQANISSLQAELDFKQNQMGIYPTASFNNSWDMRFGRSDNPVTGVFENTKAISSSFGFNSQVNIFNFFSQRNTIQSYKYQLAATLASEEKAKNDIALRVGNAYLLALQAKEQVKLNQLQIGLTTEQLDVTRKRVRAGGLPELNAAEIEAQLARDSSAYVNAVANRQLQLLQLKAILNLDAAVDFDIQTPPIESIPIQSLAELQPEDVYNLALTNLPQQRINDFRLKAAEKSRDAARGAMYPSLSAGIGLSTGFYGPLQRSFPGNPIGDDTTGLFVRNGASVLPVISPKLSSGNTVKKSFSEVWNGYGDQLNRNFGQTVGISINVPLFNGNRARTNWERSKLNIKNIQLQKDLDNQTLKQDIYTAYNNAVAALQQQNASLKAVETAQRSYDLARKRFDVSLLSTFELITIQNNLFTAQINLLLSRYDYVFKMKVLEFYKGQGLSL